MTKLGLILVLISLAGCTTAQKIYVPVAAPCVKPKIPPVPHLPVQDLKYGDTPDKVVKAYAASVDVQNQYIRIIHKIID